MSATIGADYFNAFTVGIGHTLYCPLYFIVEARPAAMRVELIIRTIKRCVATTADIDTVVMIFIIFSCVSSVSSLVENDPFFLRCQLVIALCAGSGGGCGIHR